ncbi:Alpha/Beta hydrolase protein [Xylariales sp. AK1849]|nr:Alpha/Beta hydrolase protein [Xylariales sp. AK1849]
MSMMKAVLLDAVLLLCSTTAATAAPTVFDKQRNVTYQGLHRNDIEVFLSIPYGQDTSGANRFKPPQPAVPESGSTIVAQSYGPACPQQVGAGSPPLSLSDVTDISEDCLNLDVARPKGTCSTKRLPVMVFVHGGSFWAGQTSEITTAPDGLILQAAENGTPVIHVAMNYRLGVFGFAQSDALKSEASENAGLRDQRLAIEWVRDNIANFGGDPEKITIFGQSSGGLAIGMQIMAYGASQPVPFQQGICESQALEPGITGNFTYEAMRRVVDYVGCNSSSLDSAETVSCLRGLDTETLLNASVATYSSDISDNVGDIWLPVVDGDFLPDAPSRLIKERRFANVTAMIGWTNNDLTAFTDTSITTPDETYDFIQSYVPTMTASNVDELLSLYPVSDFPADTAANLSAEFYRTARIFRDILMTCQPVWYAENMAAAGNDVFLYDWNQTILDPILEFVDGQAGLGPIHTSEFAYVFGNLSHYNVSGYPFDPTPEDYALETRGSRSWATFASTGRPGAEGKDTFQGFDTAFVDGDDTYSVFVVGGAHEGLSAIDGPGSTPEFAVEKLRERCAFINSPEIIEELRY